MRSRKSREINGRNESRGLSVPLWYKRTPTVTYSSYPNQPTTTAIPLFLYLVLPLLPSFKSEIQSKQPKSKTLKDKIPPSSTGAPHSVWWISNYRILALFGAFKSSRLSIIFALFFNADFRKRYHPRPIVASIERLRRAANGLRSQQQQRTTRWLLRRRRRRRRRRRWRRRRLLICSLTPLLFSRLEFVDGLVALRDGSFVSYKQSRVHRLIGQQQQQ